MRTVKKHGSHDAPYIAPQDVQDATHVRVLLAKDAISTGWGLPARRDAYVAAPREGPEKYNPELLGRLVRTPLARRIESDERLNAVTCFLPRFDLSQVRPGARRTRHELPLSRRGIGLRSADKKLGLSPRSSRWCSSVERVGAG